jgi:hypothetical protein
MEIQENKSPFMKREGLIEQIIHTWSNLSPVLAKANIGSSLELGGH